MSEAVERILTQLDALSPQVRAELVHAILRSLEPEEPGVAEAWDEELARRLARLSNGQATEVSAQQVFAGWRRLGG